MYLRQTCPTGWLQLFIFKLMLLFSTLKFVLNHSWHYTIFSVKQHNLIVKFKEKKANVFRIWLSSLFTFTDWLTHLSEPKSQWWIFVLLVSVRLSMKSKTTYSTCSAACIHSLMRSPCPYISLEHGWVP